MSPGASVPVQEQRVVGQHPLGQICVVAGLELDVQDRLLAVDPGADHLVRDALDELELGALHGEHLDAPALEQRGGERGHVVLGEQANGEVGLSHARREKQRARQIACA